MIFPDKVYDILKWVCLILIPAVDTLLGVILPAVGVSANTVSIIITIISAIGAFIGTLIGISNKNFYGEEK